MIDPVLIPLTAIVVGGAVAVFAPLARAMARKMDREASQPRANPEVAQRLERMEQSLDAIAIEVERISEGQRFTTKLLADRTSAPEHAGLPGQR
jgi:hypothetical protein